MRAIDDFRKSLPDIRSSESLNNGLYVPMFYQHLDLLLSPSLEEGGMDWANFRFNLAAYQGLKQFAVESWVNPVPETEIDWNFIADAKDIVRTKLKSSLGQEASSDHLKPFLKFTLDGYEDYLIYEALDPDSPSNPWMPFREIVHKGVLLLGLDKENDVASYAPKWFSKPTNEVNRDELNIVAASARKRGFGGFQIDRRHTAQAIVYEHIRTKTSRRNPISKKQIQKFLLDSGFNYKEQEITLGITLPLKREGLIGCNVHGFFHIGDQFDLLGSVDHHLSNLQGIRRTLELYRRKAVLNGWDYSKIPRISLEYGDPEYQDYLPGNPD
jgi:hypothetical protein